MLNPNELFPLFASLVGFAAFVAAGVNVLKYFGVIVDGQASAFVFWANVAGFVGVAVAYFTGNVDILTRIDAQLGNYALFMLSFISFIGELGAAKLFHEALKGSPVVGKSFSK